MASIVSDHQIDDEKVKLGKRKNLKAVEDYLKQYKTNQRNYDKTIFFKTKKRLLKKYKVGGLVALKIKGYLCDRLGARPATNAILFQMTSTFLNAILPSFHTTPSLANIIRISNCIFSRIHADILVVGFFAAHRGKLRLPQKNILIHRAQFPQIGQAIKMITFVPIATIAS